MRKALAAAAGLMAVGSVAVSARAEDEFDVSVSAERRVVVTTKGDWHINQAYPWKLVVTLAADKSVALSKADFALEEKRASVKVQASGSAILKGAVCIQSGEQNACRQIQKTLKIP